MQIDLLKLQRFLMLRQLSNKELFTRAGISEQCLYSLLNGRKKPRLQTIGKLAAALNVDPLELVKTE